MNSTWYYIVRLILFFFFSYSSPHTFFCFEIDFFSSNKKEKRFSIFFWYLYIIYRKIMKKETHLFLREIKKAFSFKWKEIEQRLKTWQSTDKCQNVTNHVLSFSLSLFHLLFPPLTLSKCVYIVISIYLNADNFHLCKLKDDFWIKEPCAMQI